LRLERVEGDFDEAGRTDAFFQRLLSARQRRR
jgi:hypothetical protein